MSWPVELRGITESVVTTRGPGGRWNAAALGLHAGDPVTSRTWGRTRTRRNFEREGGGYVQFVDDPERFVEAALGIYESEQPVLDAAAAWVEVEVERVDAGESDGTEWVQWIHRPLSSGIERETVPTINRGHNAVVEATVHASRLGVSAYDDDVLEERIEFLVDVARTCGGDPERRAVERLRELAGQ